MGSDRTCRTVRTHRVFPSSSSVTAETDPVVSPTYTYSGLYDEEYLQYLRLLMQSMTAAGLVGYIVRFSSTRRLSYK